MRYIQLLFLLLVPYCILAQDAYVIDKYQIDVVLDEFATANITETIDLRFTEERRGIIREIPLKGNFKSHTQKLKIDDISVLDWKFKSYIEKGKQMIRIGDAKVYLTGNQQYVIKYKAYNGIINFEKYEEFYWSLIPTDWDADIKKASFTIHLPKQLDLDQDQYKIYVGNDGSTSDYGSITKDENIIKGESLVTLGHGKGLTVGIKVPKGYFFENTKSDSKSNLKSAPQKTDFGFGLPILMILGLIGSYFKWGKNDKRPIEKPFYYPPEGMTPSEVGTFIDYQVHNRDLLCLIPYWGEQGIIKMRVMQGENGGIFLEKLMQLPSNAAEHEHYFFNNLFSTGDIIFVDELKHTFHNEFNQSKTILKNEIQNLPFYDQTAVKRFHSNIMFFYAALAACAGIICIALLSWVITGMAFFAFALALIFIRFATPKRSPRGQRVFQELEAFREAILNPSSDELAKIHTKDPAYFEKVFPYAVAFGIDKNWINNFEDLHTSPPTWYYYDNGYMGTYGDFSRDFSLKEVNQSLSVPPVADSSSSSFGGGGSVGGGFGGGGGSSW